MIMVGRGAARAVRRAARVGAVRRGPARCGPGAVRAVGGAVRRGPGAV
jgi:hypothetical protein